MKLNPIDNLEFYPPFEGFPRQGIEFLKNLKRNNNRQWFAKHREEYETYVKLPMQSLIVALEPYFARFAQEFELHPKRSLFRIYRDTRFSKDKTPYKTHVAAHAVLRGRPKGYEGSGYYMHIEPGEIFLGAGIYMPSSDQLKKIRRAISERPDKFLSVVEDKNFKRRFKALEGEKLHRAPAGYPPNHPMVEWLKFKQFFVGVSWPEGKCYKKLFVKETAEVLRDATPLVRFLNEAIQS